MTREDYEEMTKEDLRGVAEEKGIALLALDSKGTMIDKILGKTEKKEGKRTKEPPLGALHNLDGTKYDGEKVRLKIFDTETDHAPVDIVVNGHNIRVARGEWVTVHKPYVEVLKNAVITTRIQDDSGDWHTVERTTYPYAVEAL